MSTLPFPPANTPVQRGEAKICNVCSRLKPLDRFYFSKNDGYSGRCKACSRLLKAEKRKKARDKQLQRRVRQIQGTESYPKLSELCTEMVRQFGGMERLVADWHNQIQEAIKDRPGSKTVLDSFLSIAKLISALSAQTGADRELEGLSDEESELELELATSEFIEQNPQYLLAVAEAAGYRLIPDDVLDAELVSEDSQAGKDDQDT